jgi:hypothetical protein
MKIFKDLEQSVEKAELSTYEYGITDLDIIRTAIEDFKGKVYESSFIKEWFESPYVSDYDKKQSMEYINKLKP